MDATRICEEKESKKENVFNLASLFGFELHFGDLKKYNFDFKMQKEIKIKFNQQRDVAVNR
jgi:hypothetical protein